MSDQQYQPPGGGTYQQYPPQQGWQQPQQGWQQQYKPPRKKRHTLRNVLLSIVGVFVLIIIIGVAASGGSGGSKPPAHPAAASKPSTATADQQLISKLQATTGSDGNSLYSDLQSAGLNPVTLATDLCGGQASISVPSAWDGSDERAFDNAVSSTMCPGTDLTPAAPAYTTAEQQAIDAANGYLQMGTGFSREGLIQQLDSSDGDGFSKRLARFAVNHIKVNWMHQAVLSAKGYMQMGGFSCSSLEQQLDSQAGEGFTYSQAVHAAKAVGLC